MYVFVSAGKGKLEANGFRRYLYNGQKVVVEPTPTEFGEAAVVYSNDARLAANLRDRFSSGLFGAKTVETLEEAEALIAEY